MQEAEHREKLNDLNTRIASARDAIAADEAAAADAAAAAANAAADLQRVREQARQIAARKKNLEDLNAQLAAPAGGGGGGALGGLPPPPLGAPLQLQLAQAAPPPLAQPPPPPQQQQQPARPAVPAGLPGNPAGKQAGGAPPAAAAAAEGAAAGASAAPPGGTFQAAAGGVMPPSSPPFVFRAGASPSRATHAGARGATGAAGAAPAAAAAATQPPATLGAAGGPLPSLPFQFTAGASPHKQAPGAAPGALAPPPGGAVDPGWSWRTQRLECLMYRVLWVSESVKLFSEQYSPRGGSRSYELFMRATKWAQHLRGEYDATIRAASNEINTIRNKLLVLAW